MKKRKKIILIVEPIDPDRFNELPEFENYEAMRQQFNERMMPHGLQVVQCGVVDKEEPAS